jgi:hypothetical protein
MRRLAVTAALMIIAAFGLCGCTVPINGMTGMTVDQDGNLTAVFAWCGDSSPDGATLYDPRGFDGTTVAVYRAPHLAGHTASLRLDAPANGWVAQKPMPVLDPTVRYVIYGWTSDNSTSTADVEFAVTDRDRLTPGTVLIQMADAKFNFHDALIPMADFQHRGQAAC